MDSYNVSLERGFSNLDRRHFLTGNLNFVPFKELQVTPIFRFASPLPYTVTTGRDNNNDTIYNDRPDAVKRNAERGAWLKQFDVRLGWRIPIAKRKNKTVEDGENKNKITESKNAASTDLLKKYSIGIDVTILNVLNRTNLQNFVGNQLSPFFRQATSSAPARQVQIGLNFFF